MFLQELPFACCPRVAKFSLVNRDTPWDDLQWTYGISGTSTLIVRSPWDF